MRSNQQRILLIHRYFWPDSPPYAVILKEMAALLVQQGYIVDVLSSKPSYKRADRAKQSARNEKTESGFTIKRLPVFNEARGGFYKLFNFFAFPLQVFWQLLMVRRYDIVTVSSAPPVVLAFMVALACKIKGSLLVYHCMDMHPEVGRISGEFRSKIVFQLLMKMEIFTCRLAKRIVVLSSDMEAAMTKRDKSLANKIVIINNFSLPSECVDHVPDTLKKPAYTKRLIFAGNLGRFQALDKIISAFKASTAESKLELVFVGDGVMRKELQALSKDATNIRFICHQPVALAKALIRDSDFGIVSLHGGVLDYAYPSKTMTYLESGVPILLFSNQSSGMSDFLRDNGIGESVDSSKELDMKNLFCRIEEKQLLIKNREEIMQFYQEYFTQEVFNKKLLSMLDEIHA